MRRVYGRALVACAGARFNSTPSQNQEVDTEDVVIEAAPEENPQRGSRESSGPLDEPTMKAETREEMGFKTETRQLLDIVACSLYSDKEVFIRELVSNASDALEKRRHLQLVKPEEFPANEEPPAIHLSVNQSKTTFVIRDTGIGMSKEELAANLGTIASSGSKAFVRQLQESPNAAASSAEKIIGQFGVGFYSAFMVARHVKVYSRSAKIGSTGYCWESDGTGTFSITEVDGLPVGTKIVLDVKDTELSFCTPQVVERVIKKYSNFVEFEISLNGGRLNTVDALWMKSKDEVSNEDHIDFYKFISGAYDSPLFRLHYSVDAPMAIRALLYVPQSHTEKYGGGRMDSGVNLYCRRVLIQSKAKGVVPEWLRFLKGAVDSESIPLNISREHTQDGAMMRKLSTIVTKRVLKWLAAEAKTDRPKFERFVKEFGGFLKEGVCTDQIHKMEIAKLLRFETTKSDLSYPLVSLDEYRDRMQANQTHIYYLSAPSLEMAKASPYYEQYRENDLEVLVLTEPIDEFVMNHLETYAKFKLQNIETFDAQHDGWVQHKKQQIEGEKKDNTDDVKIKKALSDPQCKELSDFIAKRLLGKVGVVKSTNRLRDSPAMLADHESAQMRKLYKITGQQQGPPPKYNFHFNPEHSLVVKVHSLAVSTDAEERETAGLLVEQLFDNAVIAAGLLDDPRTMVNRLNTLMTRMAGDVEPKA
uniref:Histidine kinase/HSP90-like ATPase domain-containing protein n=1 Tax=Neobodo designis TaxID=312471 RepID=A0A7S1PQK7_NEODS